MVRPSKTRAEREILQVVILIQAVIPAIPRVPKDWIELEEDLKRIGCHGLLKKPWNLKDKGMVQELIVGVPNQYDNTVKTNLNA